MRGRHSSKTKSIAGVMPLIAWVLPMVVFMLAVILLIGSVSSLKKENGELRADLSSLRNETTASQQAAYDKNRQADAGMQSIREQLDMLLALHGGPEGLQASSSGPKLSIASFDLKFFNNTQYKYQSYTGTGTISAAGSKDSFLALLKKTLKSGGAPTTKKVEYVPVLVAGGTGTFTTDDSAEGAVEKPEYEFEIIGSIRFSASDQN